MNYIFPAMHGVEVPDNVYLTLQDIYDMVSSKKVSIDRLKQKKHLIAEIFAEKFNLGIPKHKLPEKVIYIDTFCVDLSYQYQNYISPDRIEHHDATILFKKKDHLYYFYKTFEIKNGYFVAFCTGFVSMPYSTQINLESKKEMIETADVYGILCTFHDDWSWHYPNLTSLILFQHITPISVKISQFKNSLKRWVIENKNVILNKSLTMNLDLNYLVEDIIKDSCFPLDVSSFKNLRERYPEFINTELEVNKKMSFLFNEWKNSIH